jgi:Ca2+-binding RTX toxin-like protein
VKQRTNRFLYAVVLAPAVSLATAALAAGASISGNGGPNDLTGTDQHDWIAAKGGDDTVNALAGSDLVLGGAGDDALNGGAGCDRIFAGPGNDTLDGGPGVAYRHLGRARGSIRRAATFYRCERLFGGAGNDTSNGGIGRDFMSGGRDDDHQSGGPGSDKIFANQGRDVSDGGPGDDVLWALSRKDVTAIGDTEGDELSGGDGRDRFRVRDGEVDLIHCGAGRDEVLADQFDQVDTDCEVVLRRDVTSLDQVDDGEENSTEDPAPAG